MGEEREEAKGWRKKRWVTKGRKARVGERKDGKAWKREEGK